MFQDLQKKLRDPWTMRKMRKRQEQEQKRKEELLRRLWRDLRVVRWLWRDLLWKIQKRQEQEL
jgi:hypothetical protein